MKKKIHIHRPENGSVITSIEMHTGGEPLRVITSGIPDIPGKTMLEKRDYFGHTLDAIRKALLWEPRGHRDMYGAILTNPVTDDGDVGVLFMHNEGYSTMCGHGIIALTKLLLESEILPGIEKDKAVNFDTPAGRVVAQAHRDDENNIISCSFTNVPSFVSTREESLEIPGLGRVHFDIAFGGAFYVFTEAQPLGLDMDVRNTARLIDTGMKIKKAVMDNFTISHPWDPELGYLYGTIFTGSAYDYHHFSRNVCIFANGQVDRSATGTGVSALAALLYQKGELRRNGRITVESILGTTMEVSITAITKVDEYPAVIPEVYGRAFYTGTNEYWLDPADPLGDGFLVSH